MEQIVVFSIAVLIACLGVMFYLIVKDFIEGIINSGNEAMSITAGWAGTLSPARGGLGNPGVVNHPVVSHKIVSHETEKKTNTKPSKPKKSKIVRKSKKILAKPMKIVLHRIRVNNKCSSLVQKKKKV